MVMLFCFVSLLRVGECFDFLAEDVVIGEGALVLFFRSSQTREPRKVELVNPVVVALFQKYVERFPLKSCSRVFPISYGTFKLYFVQVLGCFDMQRFRLTLHFLRRGGAARLYMNGVSFDTIMVFGGRASESSCTFYIKAAEVLVARIQRKLSNESSLYINVLGSMLPYFFSSRQKLS